MKAVEVFPPSTFPEITYVSRKRDFEEQLQDALEVLGSMVVVSGPSKSGKTVLVNKVVGDENLIAVTGASISSPEDLWDVILENLDVQITVSEENVITYQLNASLKGSGSVGSDLVAKGSAEASGGGSYAKTSKETKIVFTNKYNAALHAMTSSNKILFFDDFHYVKKELQIELSNVLKDAASKGMVTCIATVPHRGDDVLRSNSDLRGRVTFVDMDYWELEDLVMIGDIGFPVMNLFMPTEVVKRFAMEAAGSPQLMQLICLNSCRQLGFRKAPDKEVKIPEEEVNVEEILIRASNSCDYRTIVHLLSKGPRIRGTPRSIFEFQDGTEGDVYDAILKSFMYSSPTLSVQYDNLLERISAICKSDSPVGSSVTGACAQMSDIITKHTGGSRILDWDPLTSVLDIADPYLLFYLRWSDVLKKRNIV